MQITNQIFVRNFYRAMFFEAAFCCGLVASGQSFAQAWVPNVEISRVSPANWAIPLHPGESAEITWRIVNREPHTIDALFMGAEVWEGRETPLNYQFRALTPEICPEFEPIFTFTFKRYAMRVAIPLLANAEVRCTYRVTRLANSATDVYLVFGLWCDGLRICNGPWQTLGYLPDVALSMQLEQPVYYGASNAMVRLGFTNPSHLPLEVHAGGCFDFGGLPFGIEMPNHPQACSTQADGAICFYGGVWIESGHCAAARGVELFGEA